MVDQSRPFFEMVASTPLDVNDRSRFGQLQETAKDAFIKELTDFFDYTTSDGFNKINELPNIQKFSFGSNGGSCGLETVVDLITAYGDTPDKFPMISITSSSFRERKMNLGSNFVAQVQYPASISGSKTGPFDLSVVPGSHTIQIQTTPNDSYTQTSTIMLDSSLFSDYTSVSIDDIVRVVNKTQALYYTLSKTSDGYLRIEAGGIAARYDLNSVELTGGNSYILDLLGLTVGQADSYTNVENPVKNRYGISGDMVINIDVIGDSLNTRVELSDLVMDFFTYYMQDKVFQLFGRSFFDREVDPEWFHIVLKNQFAWSGEINKPRQGGEQYEHIYATRGSIPIYIEDFIDKSVSDTVKMVDTSNITVTRVAEGSDITGDYFQTNYRVP